MGQLTSTLRIALTDDVSGPAKGVADALKKLGGSAKDLGKLNKIDALKNAAAGLRQAQTAFQATQENVKNLARELAGVENPSRKMQAGLQAARKAASEAAREFERQKGIFSGARKEVEGFGASVGTLVSGERKLRAEVAQTNNALKSRPAILSRVRAGMSRAAEAATHGSHGLGVGGLAGMAAGAVGAHGAVRGVEAVAHTYREYDDLVRYQRAILGLTPEQQKPLIDQATGGSVKGFNDLQILHAQLDLAQRGLNQDAIIPIVRASAGFAQALGTDLPTAAKTLEGILFSTGKDLHDSGAAVAAANKAASFATKLAKIGGLNEEDVRQFYKYGGAPGSVAGLSDPSIGAIAAILKKSNMPGDEAGTFVRALSSRLVSPTAKGLGALDAMGIRYSDYTKMPNALSGDNLALSVQRRLGKKLSADQIRRLNEIGQDQEVIGDRGSYTTEASKVIGESFPKTKKGQISALTAKEIAKVAGDAHKLAIESVDSEGLLRRIIAANPSLAQSNAMFGDKQGGRFAVLAKSGIELFNQYVEKLAHAGDDFHTKIASERLEGFAGAVQKAEAAILNMQTAIGRAWDDDGKNGPMTRLTNAFADTVQHLSEMDRETMKIASGLTAAAAGLGAFTASLAIARLALPGGQALPTVGAALGFLGRSLGIPGLLAGGVWAATQFVESETPEQRARRNAAEAANNPGGSTAEQNKAAIKGRTSFGEELAAARQKYGYNSAEAQAIIKKAGEIKDAVNIEGKVDIDAGPLDTLIGKARELKSLLEGITGSVGKAGAAVGQKQSGLRGSMGGTLRGAFADTGIG